MTYEFTIEVEVHPELGDSLEEVQKRIEQAMQDLLDPDFHIITVGLGVVTK